MINKLKKNRSEIFKVLLFTAVLLVYFPVYLTLSHAQNKIIPIFFYSSEIDIKNHNFLKIEFDNYLSKAGPYEFFPFSDRELFENQIREKKESIIIVSGWHYYQIYEKYSLYHIMAGVKKGKTHQKRVLVTERLSDLKSAEKMQIASATGIEHTADELGSIFNNKTDSFKILEVPRDIAALMSVEFGISQCALATENSLNKLSSIHPSLFKRMKILATGRPSWLLIVSVRKDFREKARQILNIIKDMPNTPPGKSRIKMLGLDGWEKIEGSDRLKAGGL